MKIFKYTAIFLAVLLFIAFNTILILRHNKDAELLAKIQVKANNKLRIKRIENSGIRFFAERLFYDRVKYAVAVEIFDGTKWTLYDTYYINLRYEWDKYYDFKHN